MGNGTKRKEKDMMMGASSLSGRDMDIGGLIKKTREIDCRNTMFIDREDIIPNPENEKRFPQVEIEELSEWIYFRKRLYHDLIVVPVEGTGKYMLVDGERRHRAISMLDDRQYSEVFPMGVNCCVFPASTDSTLLRLDSTLANYLQRHTDVYLRRQEILDMHECLKDLKKRDMADGDVISHMSDILGIKEKQLKRYINTACLIPEFEEMLKESRITLNEATKIASLGSDSQMLLYEKQSEKGRIALSDLKEAEDTDNIRKAEQELAAIADSIDRYRGQCEAEAEKSRMLAERTKDKEKIKRQGKREQKAKQKLEKEEKRYCLAEEALETARSANAAAKSGTESKIKSHDAVSAISGIESCLGRIETCLGLVADNDILFEKLENINGRFFVLLENCHKLRDQKPFVKNRTE